jgi:hypothetical protein
MLAMWNSSTNSGRSRILLVLMASISLMFLSKIERFSDIMKPSDVLMIWHREGNPESNEDRIGEICHTLDVNEAQEHEIKEVCPETVRNIDTKNYLVICNVNPTTKELPQEVVNTTLILPKSNTSLRNQWSYNAPISHYARLIESYQTNCSRKVMTYHVDNSFGIGSHLGLWSQAMCNAMEQGYRIRIHNPVWLWMDQVFCSHKTAIKSPLLCYLPRSEFRCGCDEVPPELNVSDPRDKQRTSCALLKGEDDHILNEFRAASIEYLFQNVSPLVVQEAERQVGLLFGPKGTPEDLITVHIRWGDKFWEMPNRSLVAIHTYMQAVSTLLHQQNGHNTTANIYLATEDPRAYQEFQNATPSGWNVFYDLTVEELSPFRPSRGNRASRTAKNSKGRAGLASFASMLVALEAKLFVLTTRSNWSRMINYLRMNIIDPRCGNCTRMVDLVPGVW